jgi:hypothetical protein
MLIKKYITALVKFIIHLGGSIFVKPFLLVARCRAMKRIPENPKILYVSLAFRGDLVLTFRLFGPYENVFRNRR